MDCVKQLCKFRKYLTMKALSTYRILKSKAFNENIDESWIDWAIEMIEAGYESENLYMLAGETKPYDQSQLQELTNKVFQDLNLDYSDRDASTRNYVYHLILSSIDHPETYFRMLRELRDIYYSDARYLDFFLLYYAKGDLAIDEVQWYWDGANRENIDQIIRAKFETWIREFEQECSGNKT
jgi:hypothetical protein